MLNERREKGENPFPHKFDVTISLTDFIEKFGNEVTENGKVLTDESVRVAGTFPYHFFSTKIFASEIFRKIFRSHRR